MSGKTGLKIDKAMTKLLEKNFEESKSSGLLPYVTGKHRMPIENLQRQIFNGYVKNHS